MIKKLFLFLIIFKKNFSDDQCKSNYHFHNLLKNSNYFEPIEIVTEDNYILKMFRVKKNKK